MIGSGAIGGKACGMLLARKIAETEIPEFRQYGEPHDSFYIGSDVFYTYIVSNGDWRLAAAHPSAIPGGLFRGRRRAEGTPSVGPLSGEDPGGIPEGVGLLWPEPLHRALVQLPGGTASAMPLRENMSRCSA